MSTTNLSSRLAHLIKNITTEHRRNKQLEEQTGIPADRWSAFVLGRQRPTAEMIEAVGRLHPQYSEWLLTGKLDARRQLDPDTRVPIDLSKLDEINPLTPPYESDEPKLSPEEIESMVDAFFGQVAKRKRKKNGDQKS